METECPTGPRAALLQVMAPGLSPAFSSLTSLELRSEHAVDLTQSNMHVVLTGGRGSALLKVAGWLAGLLPASPQCARCTWSG